MFLALVLVSRDSALLQYYRWIIIEKLPEAFSFLEDSEKSLSIDLPVASKPQK